MGMQSSVDGNESMFADFSALHEVSKALRASFGGISVGVAYHKKGSGEDAVDLLKSARSKLYEEDSLYKYGLPEAIDHVVGRVKKANKKLVDVGEFLYWVLEAYEETESKNVLKLGEFGLMDKRDARWVAAYKDPLGIKTFRDRNTWQEFGGYTTSSRTVLAQSGFLYTLFNPSTWSLATINPFANPYDGLIGFDFSILDQKETTITRNASGEREVMTWESEYGSVALAAGWWGNEILKPTDEKVGMDVSVTFMSFTSGEEDLDTGQASEQGLSVGGLGAGFMATKYGDGTQGVDASVLLTDFGIHTRATPGPDAAIDEESIRRYGQAGLID